MMSETFGAWLRRQLKRRQMRQADLARRLETSSGVVSHWARDTRVPEPESCQGIADALGLSVDEVLTAAGHRTEATYDDPITAGFVARLQKIEWDPISVTVMESAIQTLENIPPSRRGGQVRRAPSGGDRSH